MSQPNHHACYIVDLLYVKNKIAAFSLLNDRCANKNHHLNTNEHAV